MAGLVPAIHVLHHPPMLGGYVYILASAPNGILYAG
jgi:putative endonuclease